MRGYCIYCIALIAPFKWLLINNCNYVREALNQTIYSVQTCSNLGNKVTINHAKPQLFTKFFHQELLFSHHITKNINFFVYFQMQLQSKPKPPQLQPRRPHLPRNQSQQSRLQLAQARVKPEVELTRVISLTWWSSPWVTQLMPHSIMRLIDWRGWWRSTWPTCRVLSRGTWWTWWAARWCLWCWPTCRTRLVTSQHFCFRYSPVNQLSSLHPHKDSEVRPWRIRSNCKQNTLNTSSHHNQLCYLLTNKIMRIKPSSFLLVSNWNELENFATLTWDTFWSVVRTNIFSSCHCRQIIC